MPRMKIPAPAKPEPWKSTLAIDAFADDRRMTSREVRRLLRCGRLPFVQISGQIRIPRAAVIEEATEGK